MRIGIRTMVVLAVTAAVGLWAADDPLMATWKLNVEKSSFGSITPPKSQVIKLEAVGSNGLRHTEEIVNARGEAHHNNYTAQFGDQGSPMEGDANRDTRVLNRIDSHTMEIVYKKDGKVVERYHRVVAQDGKTMTVTYKGETERTQRMNRTMVFDRQ